MKGQAFHKKHPKSRARNVAGSVWYGCQSPGSTLLVMGGYAPGSSRDLLFYELPSGRWQTAGSLPTPRDSAGVAMMDARMYIVGGECDGKRLNSVALCDVNTGAWTAGPSMRTARGRLGVAALGGVLYAAGGWNTGGRILRTVEALDPREGIWRSITSMSIERRGFGFVALDGMLYAAGGHHNTVERYDPSSGKWEPAESMAEWRWNVGASVLGDTMYVVGGHNGVTLSSVERYRAGSGWETVPSMAINRAGAAVAGCAGRLYVAGGRNLLRNRHSSVAVFDPETAAWNELPALPAGRSFASAVVLEWPSHS